MKLVIFFQSGKVSLHLKNSCWSWKVEMNLESGQWSWKIPLRLKISKFPALSFLYQLKFATSVDLSIFTNSFPTSMILSKLSQHFLTSVVLSNSFWTSFFQFHLELSILKLSNSYLKLTTYAERLLLVIIWMMEHLVLIEKCCWWIEWFPQECYTFHHYT